MRRNDFHRQDAKTPRDSKGMKNSQPSLSASLASRRLGGRSLFVSGLIVVLTACGKPPALPPAGPPQVVVQTVVAQDLPLTRTLVGRTAANHTVDIVARVTGTLLERPYKEGEPIAQGAVLFRIDPQEYAASLEAARAKVAQVEAQMAKAENDLKRVEPLAKAGAAPVAELDTARTSLQAAQADLRAAKAQVIRAELDLGYTTISAPFAGLAGKAAADPGALVSPSSGKLCVLDQVDPMAVEFTMSEREILAFKAEIAAGRLRLVDTEHVLVTVALINGETYPESGKLSFRAVRIDVSTGTALMRAVFPNAKGFLRAGQFVRVTLAGATRIGAILVPQSAVILSPTGSSVYVVKADQTVEARPVTAGTWEGQQWLIEGGLKPGETIIVDGVQKARPGAKVQVSTAPVAPPAGGNLVPGKAATEAVAPAGAAAPAATPAASPAATPKP
jgi:membrane fusion protein (multidrug efflux system)